MHACSLRLPKFGPELGAFRPHKRAGGHRGKLTAHACEGSASKIAGSRCPDGDAEQASFESAARQDAAPESRPRPSTRRQHPWPIARIWGQRVNNGREVCDPYPAEPEERNFCVRVPWARSARQKRGQLRNLNLSCRRKGHRVFLPPMVCCPDANGPAWWPSKPAKLVAGFLRLLGGAAQTLHASTAALARDWSHQTGRVKAAVVPCGNNAGGNRTSSRAVPPCFSCRYETEPICNHTLSST